MKSAVRSLLPFLLLLSCGEAYSPEGPKYDTQPALLQHPTQTDVTIHVHWMLSRAQLYEACGQNSTTSACALSIGPDCVIRAFKPKDFNDVDALATLGHEMMHCLGATHKER